MSLLAAVVGKKSGAELAKLNRDAGMVLASLSSRNIETRGKCVEWAMTDGWQHEEVRVAISLLLRLKEYARLGEDK